MNQSLFLVVKWKVRKSMMEVVSQCRNKLLESDIVLIGLGKEFNIKRCDILKGNQLYESLELEKSPLNELERTWIELTLMSHCLDNEQNTVVKDRIQIYNDLAEYLSSNGKSNYFVVTTCNDDIINRSLFDTERVVAPCGTLAYMKCDTGCFKHVYETKEVYDNIYSILSKHFKNGFTDRKAMWSLLKEAMPQCPMCKQVMSINMVKTNNYSEEGYRDKWDSYMAWLQKTLNRNLVMLELGEGFDTPTVIRWPFEKVAAVNNKSTLIRVNDRFWQISEDIQAKAIPVNMPSEDFIKALVGKE